MSNSSQFSGGVKSIQRGTILINAPSLSGSATITSVDTTKTELRFLGAAGNSGTIADNFGYITLTNATTITATKLSSAGAATTFTASWELTEFY